MRAVCARREMDAVSVLAESRYSKGPFRHDRVGRTTELVFESEQTRPDRRFEAKTKFYHIRSIIPQSRSLNHVACQHLNRHASQPFQGTCLPDIVPEVAHEFPNARKFIRGSLKKWRSGKLRKWRTCNGNGALPNGGTKNVSAFNDDLHGSKR